MFGYARVSTNGQDLSAQDAELRSAGCAKVFKEKVSGAKTDRPELAKAIRLGTGNLFLEHPSWPRRSGSSNPATCSWSRGSIA